MWISIILSGLYFFRQIMNVTVLSFFLSIFETFSLTRDMNEMFISGEQDHSVKEENTGFVYNNNRKNSNTLYLRENKDKEVKCINRTEFKRKRGQKVRKTRHNKRCLFIEATKTPKNDPEKSSKTTQQRYMYNAILDTNTDGQYVLHIPVWVYGHKLFKFSPNLLSVQVIVVFLEYGDFTSCITRNVIDKIQKKLKQIELCKPLTKAKRLRLHASLMQLSMVLHLNEGYANEYTNGILSVKLLTVPMQMGQSVELECIMRLKSPPIVKSWTKIPDGVTIAYQNNSLNRSKYHLNMDSQPSLIKYNLVISDFDLSDLNEYKCDADFYSNRVTLDMHTPKFVAVPERNEIGKKVTLSNKVLKGSVIFPRIYPKPLCSGYFSGKDITKKITIDYSRTYILYQMTLQLQAEVGRCAGIFKINCTVGPYIQRIFVLQFVYGCEVAGNTRKSSDHPLFLTAVGITVIIVSLAFTILKYCQWRCHCNNFCKKSENTTIYTDVQMNEPDMPRVIPKTMIARTKPYSSFDERCV